MDIVIKNDVTSVYQSIELMTSGLSPITCDYLWFNKKGDKCEEWSLADVSQSIKLYKRNVDIIPAWSLKTLLTILPEYLNDKVLGDCCLSIRKTNQHDMSGDVGDTEWLVCYENSDGDISESSVWADLKDSVVFMMIKVLSRDDMSNMKYDDRFVERYYKSITEHLESKDKEFYDEVMRLEFQYLSEQTLRYNVLD